jgi:hypothetical protein
MSFDLFGPATKCDIRVGYISTDRGFVDHVGIHEANQYAQLNPGTQFIFRNREKVQYLNINEVNKLQPEDMLPKSNAGEGGDCKGIVGLNPEGDTSINIDEGLGLTDVVIDQTGRQLVRDTTRVNFYGGGGVGVQGNPIVGIDGSLMAVDVIHSGFGYQYPPLVNIEDDRGVGSGAVAIAVLSDKIDGTEELYNQEDDFEEYILDRCAPPLQGVGFGKRYGPNGEDLGDWNPGMYIGTQRDPIAKQIENYQELLATLREGAHSSDLGSGRRLDPTKTRILEWWTTRDKTPLKVISPESTNRTKYDVYHWAWGANPGTNDAIDNLYIKLFGRRSDPEGLAYWKNIHASGQSLAQIEEAMKTFPEWKQVCEGECIPVMQDATYKFGTYWEYDKNSFMNAFAISPVSPSNVKGSDMAGKTYTFEWQENFPWEGDYIFRVQADNDAKLYINNEPVSIFNKPSGTDVKDIEIGSGGAAGHVISKPLKFKKYIPRRGVYKISVDLFNHQVKEMVKKITNVSEVTQGADSDVVNFKLISNADYANGFQILDLDIDVEKTYKGPQLNETVTKTVEYGRPYKVQFRSGGSGSLQSGKLIKFTGLHSANNPIEVTNNNTRLCLKDGHGGDCNASFTIDRGNVRFSDDGKTIEGTGKATFTLSWNDNPRTAGTALGTIKIMDKSWTQSGRSGSKTQTVIITASNNAGSNQSRIQLRNKGQKVMEMEDAGGTDFNDLVASCSSGKFYDINGSTCKFIVDPPPNPAASNLKDERLDKIFNTIDWIGKANRKLWKINPGAGKDANFINRFGVLPFDPTEVEKIEKRVTRDVISESKASVKFLRGEDGRNYMKVTGTGKAKVFFELNVNDRPGISSLALTEIKIKANDGDVILRRDPNRRYANERASGEFTAGQKYLVKTIGASSGAGSRIGVDKTTIGYDDDYDNGYDQNGLLKITAVTPINTTERITEDVMGYPDYPNASSDDYAGTHEIIWDNLKFPDDGNYSIEIMVDDNVVLTFSHPGREDIIMKKDGFKIRGDGSTATGKSIDVKYFREGSYRLKAELEQIPGKPLAKGNPMALAVQIKTAYISEDVEVISAKSWNQNPLGIGMVIDAPMPTIPQELPPDQKGRCPNNPIWTTRFPGGEQTWYPVRVDFWKKFMNRYAISPIPPLGTDGSDGAGVSYINNWQVDLPHEGFYGVKATIDKLGKISIDGNEILGPNSTKMSLYDSLSPIITKTFLTKGLHQITVEVENDKQFEFNIIDKKIFSTADWASKQNNTQVTVENEATTTDVVFKVNTSADYSNGIDIDGLFGLDKQYKGPQINETITKTVEYGKVYNVQLRSGGRGQLTQGKTVAFTGLHSANNPIEVTNNNTRLCLKDGHGSDCNASFTIDRGNVKFSDDGRSIIGEGKATFTLSWNDNPRHSGTALGTIQIGDKSWSQSGRSGSQQRTVMITNKKNAGSNEGRIQLQTKGETVLRMEDAGDNDYNDLVCSASVGKFYDINGSRCKFKIEAENKVETVYGEGLVSGSAKAGVTYSGPPISTYASGELGAFITPTWNTDEDYIRTHNGTTWTMTWNNVDFPEDGTYDIKAQADDELIVKLDGIQITKATVGNGLESHMFNAPKGKRTLELTLMNLDFQAPFSTNPAVAAVKITKKTNVAKIDPRTGKAKGKPWTVNPIGVSAILIPPPCPKMITGVGKVDRVDIFDPGNGFTPPVVPSDIDSPSYPVGLGLDDIKVVDGGINYGPGDVVCVKDNITGEERCFEPEFGPFGQITKVTIDPGIGDGMMLTSTPQIRVRSRGKVPTGISAQFAPQFRVIRDPIIVPDPSRLIQVTDLVGLKRTGFYDGKPYYGAVFYKDGIRYAGYYQTTGQLIQIYDTLQESIDARITTPPSAIQRQGTDINSNDPRLNIPGTPNNLI